MGKITPRFKFLLVLITFLGFTNFILSETRKDISGFLYDVKKAPFFSAEENTSSEELEVNFLPLVSKPATIELLKAAEEPTISLSSSSLEICKGEISVSLPYTTTGEPTHYSIDFSSSSFTDITSAELGSSPLSLTIPSSVSPGTYSANVTVTNSQGTSGAKTFSITVKEIPTVSSVSNVEACTGATIPVNFSGNSISGTSYNWINSNPAMGLPASGTGNITFTTTNTTSSTLTAQITVTPVANGCSGASKTFTVVVYPKVTTTKPLDVVFCNGSTTSSINFTGSAANIEYRWTNDNTAIGLNASGEGALPSFSAKNITDSPLTANIKVIPMANGCEGISQTFTIKVNPSPSFQAPANVVSCNNQVVPEILFTGNTVEGTSYKWTNDTPSIGLVGSGSGSGSIPSFSAQNNSSSPVTATLVVTPVANDCEGSPKSFTITVNPTATFTKPSDVTVCSGGTVPAINFTGSTVAGTTFKWTNDSNLIGLPAVGSGNIPSFTTTNTTNSPINAQFTVTPVANECEGTPQTFNVTVYPTTNLTDPTDLVVCNGETVSGITFGGSTISGTSYKWTNNNTSIGLNSTGTGNISSFTATNSSNSPVTAQITVIPVANECEGIPQTFTIKVNPTASFTKPQDVVLCNGGTFSGRTFSGSNVSGTTYKWEIDRQDFGMSSSSGTGSFPTFTATNSSNQPLVAQVTVTPVANGCDGNHQVFTIKVNPSPTFSQPDNIVVCKEEVFSGLNFTGESVPGTTFKWVNNNSSIGLSANGTGSIPSFTAKNTTNAPISARIKVTPITEGCEGPAKEFTITVNPLAGVNDQDDVFACNEEILPALNFTGSNVSGTIYTWTNDNSSIGLAASGTGSLPSFTATNETNETQVATIILTPVANGCSGSTKSFYIIVYPTISIVAPEIVITPPTCKGESDGVVRIGTVYGGNGQYLFSIDSQNFGDDKSFSGLGAGTHTIYIKDTQRCSFQQQITVPEPDEILMTEATSTPTSCFGGNDGTVTAGTVTGGNGSFTYSLDNTNFSDSNTFSDLSAGVHTIFVRDSKGCSIQKTVTVNQPAQLNAVVSKTNINCYGGSDGSITITTATGGSNQYEYRINGTSWQSVITFTGLAPGSYNVQIRDKNAPACVIVLQAEYELTQPAAPLAVTVTTTRTTSYGTSTGSATANPTGGTSGYTYEWRREGQSAILQTTKTVNNFPAGNYVVTVVDKNGCRKETSLTIIDRVRANIIATSECLSVHDMIRTSKFRIDMDNIAGGYGSKQNFKYEWNFGSGATPQTATGQGAFQVTYANSGDKDVTLWVTDEANIKTEYIFYHYVGGCFEGCGSTSNFLINTDNFFIGDINGNPLTGEACEQTADKYLWIDILKNANGYSLSAELNYSVSNGETTVARKAIGCFAQVISGTPGGNGSNAAVYAPIPLGLFRLFPVQSTGNDADKLTWKCGETFNVEQINLRWTNQDIRGCNEGTKPMCYGPNNEMEVITPVLATAEPQHILCKGDSTGSIKITAVGGTRPYQYSINGENGSYKTTNEFFDLSAGDYSGIWVKDSRGKKFHVPTVTIQESATNISLTVSEDQPILCYGQTTDATVYPEGGTAPYTYLWNDAREQTTATAYELEAGNYTVTVIDANGCQMIKSISVSQPEPISTAIAGEDQIFSCGFNRTFLEANTPDSGIGQWSIVSGTGGIISEPGNPGSGFTGGPGTYTLHWTISHPDGTCSTTDEVLITFVDDCSKIDFDGTDDYITFGDNYGFTSGTFTIEAWVKLHSVSGIKTVLSKRNAANPGLGGYDLIVNNGAPTFRWGNSSVSTSSKLGIQRWYHLAVIFKDSKASLYVDGINVGNSSATNPTTISSPFLIGAMNHDATPDLPQNYFHGWIEEVRLWKTALSEEQVRFMMNQRIEASGTAVKGTALPINVPSNLSWDSLSGYYRLLSNETENGVTKDRALNKIDGILKNIQTLQENTAPLPYVSAASGVWRDRNNWAQTIVWDAPNSLGINGDPINWNIAKISHDFTSGGRNITLLGLLSESGKLVMANPNETMDEKNSGQALTVTHYLKLNGSIDLVGESQLIQTDINGTRQTITSILEESSTGFIERDQQGTANSYNYNYWSSPVSLQGAANNSTYTIASVMLDGTNPEAPKGLSFNNWHEYADGPYSTPRKISNYWLHKFRGTANVYSEWKHIGSTGILNAGEGYTMKGTSGHAAIEDRQNYTFKGKPNNGTIALAIGTEQNYLLGNPYPSAIDVSDFIMDNLKDVAGGRNTRNIFNGAIYFWDHFSGGNTHILKEYVGGYATRNLLDGVPAISNDERVNANDARGSKIPGPYIPVGQGFFINTAQVSYEPGAVEIHGGDVLFKNGQRKFIRESSGNTGNSVFLRPEEEIKEQEDTRSKIRLDFKSPLKYNRQILVGADPNTTEGFDLGYDAALNDNIPEDMYWLINNGEYVIQGVPDLKVDRVLPIGVKIKEEGDLIIKINKLENLDADFNIFVKDLEKETFWNLKKGDFAINLEPGLYNERFQIVFKEEIVSEPEEKEEPQKPGEGTGEEKPGEVVDKEISIKYISGSQELVIQNPQQLEIVNVTLYSLGGQIIEEHRNLPNSKELVLPVRSYSSAVYLVKLTTPLKIIQKKIIISN